MMANLYMMPKSSMGYSQTTPRPVSDPIGSPLPGMYNPPAAAPQPVATPPPNQLQSVATRASGPSQGYDPSYLQNLATSIGGLFSGNNKGGVQNINPLGNLSDISPSSGIGGNAPTQGLPLTWLQQALNGGGFSAPTPSVVTPNAPTTKPKAPSVNGIGA